MKNILIAIVLTVVFTASTAYAIATYSYTDAKNTSYINNELFDQKGYVVVRFQDTIKTGKLEETNTCYIVTSSRQATDKFSNPMSISCVK